MEPCPDDRWKKVKGIIRPENHACVLCNHFRYTTPRALCSAPTGLRRRIIQKFCEMPALCWGKCDGFSMRVLRRAGLSLITGWPPGGLLLYAPFSL